MGVNILVQCVVNAPGERQRTQLHSTWDATRYGGDRMFASEFTKQPHDVYDDGHPFDWGDVPEGLYRPQSFTEARELAGRCYGGVNETRLAEVLSILDEMENDPALYFEFSY